MRMILSLLAMMMLSPLASAQTNPPKRPVKEMPVTIVKGRPPGPGAFYVLERSSARGRTTALEKSFVPKIVGSVEQAPF